MKNLLILLAFLSAFTITAQQLAFPGAEGHGRFATGGRGGTIYKVTNLNDSGAGSLREAVEASGTRTVVFDVGGTINLSGSLKITNPNITIAGQTAPSDSGGICLANGGFTVAASNVIIQHIRFRLGDNGYSVTGTNYTDADTFTINPSGANVSDIIVDHCSISWSIDENLSMFNDNGTAGNTTSDVTFSNLIVSHALSESHHSKGEHSKSILFNYNSRNVSLLKTYVTGGKERHVRMNEGVTSEWHNNIFYGFYDAGAINVGAKLDAENNQWIESGYDLAAYSNAILKQIGTGYTTEAYNYTSADNRLHHSGNVVNATYPPSQLTPAVASGWTNEGTRGVDSGYTTLSIAAAETHIIAEAGATLPVRDSYDTQLIADYQAGNPAYLIDTQLEVGGYPSLAIGTPSTDTDNDGMPDSYEDANGLDKNLASDAVIITGNGYSNLENYIHQISGATVVDVTGFNITQINPSINIPETLNFTIENIAPSNATNQTVTWSSSNEAVATINATTGAVTPLSVGTTTIRADANGDGAATIFDTEVLTVTNSTVNVTSVNVLPKGLILTSGATQQMTVEFNGGSSQPTDQTGVWSSSDANVFTINSSGVLTPLANGTANANFISNDGSFGDPTQVVVSLPSASDAVGIIASSLADAKEDLSDGTIYNSTIEIGKDIGTVNTGLVNAVHFTGHNIPAQQNIQSAVIEFTANDIPNSSGPVTLQIRGEISANPLIYSETNGDITSRTLTTASVTWNPEDWTTNGTKYLTVDIKDIIQELVDQAGYDSTDAINIQIIDQSGTNTRVAVSYDSGENSPRLLVTYGANVGQGYATYKMILKNLIRGL